MDRTTLLDVIVNDCRSCVSGLEENDPHLLTLGAERMANHCPTILSLITQANEVNVRESLELLLQNLQKIRTMVDEQLLMCHIQEMPLMECPLNPESIWELRKMGMPWAKIARAFGISRNSMYKFRMKHQLGEPNQTMSEMDLRLFMLKVNEKHPNAGTGLMQGALLAAGFRVSKKRVWKTLREIDPVGVAMRGRIHIKRRFYKVQGANYLWHMDSTHKLIMYGLVIHGIIDGYSRMIIYLNVADNNRAKTVLNMFKSGVAEYGLPRRVRADRGVETVRVRDFQVEHSQSSNSFIYGRSVHNVRIERLWKDVNSQITSVFKEIFFELEEEDCLNIENPLDIQCLSYVFAPRIQESLQAFILQWNNHCVRTMRSRTPHQVWLLSMMKQGLPETGIEDLRDDDLEDMTDEDEDSFDSSENELDRDIIHLECQRFLPDPMYEDNAQGKILYKSLRQHLLNLS